MRVLKVDRAINRYRLAPSLGVTRGTVSSASLRYGAKTQEDPITARATRLFPMLSVFDLTRSVAFYGDILGGRETFRYPTEGDPEFIVLRLGDSDIGLGTIAAATPIHGRPIRPASGHRIELCIYVQDVDDAVDALRNLGAPIVLDPIDQTWGERVAYAEDPDGNLAMLTR